MLADAMCSYVFSDMHVAHNQIFSLDSNKNVIGSKLCGYDDRVRQDKLSSMLIDLHWLGCEIRKENLANNRLMVKFSPVTQLHCQIN